MNNELKENIIVRIEPINTRILKNKYVDVNQDKLSFDVSKARFNGKNPPFYSSSVQYTCFQLRNLRLRTKDKETVNNIRRVLFDFGSQFCFYQKNQESEGKCKFEEIDKDFILYLEPFGPIGKEVFIEAVWFTDYINVESEEYLEENKLFLEWDECNISKDNVALFNQKNPDFPTDFWQLSSAVTTQLILITDLSDKKALISKDGRKDIVLKENIQDFGETLYDHQKENSDFDHYRKRATIIDRAYVNITAEANIIEEICRNVPHRIPYNGENIATFTNPPQMKILVLIQDLNSVYDYLDQKPCSYSVYDATEMILTTLDERKQQQKILYERAIERANYYEFFKQI